MDRLIERPDYVDSSTAGTVLGQVERVPRATKVVGAAALGAWMLASSGLAPALDIDTGTRLSDRIVVDPSEVQFVEIRSDSGTAPARSTGTLMARINELAPLSLRQWAPVFGVTHTAVNDWLKSDPADRPELGQVLELLEDAGDRRADLASWLTTPLPNLNVMPLQLLTDRRWRAFRGATRVRPAPVEISSEELLQRRRDSIGWAITDTPTAPEPE
jgi:hypothetical protein